MAGAPAVRSPAKFLRVAMAVEQLTGELAGTPPAMDVAARARLTGMYGQFLEDLRGALSPEVYAELRRLIRVPAGEPQDRQLRLAYIELRAWLRGVPLEFQVEVPAPAARPPEAGVRHQNRRARSQHNQAPDLPGRPGGGPTDGSAPPRSGGTE
ncbi:MAG TPA: proteasome activator [Streptosporangiaceae bacterium]